MAWIFLLYEEPARQPSGDHVHHEKAPKITEQFDEKVDTTPKEEQQAESLIDSIIDQIDEMDSGEHSSPWLSPKSVKKNMEIMCGVYADICNKTVWESSLTDTQKLYYQAVIIAKIRAMDDVLKKWNLRETLTYIKLFEDSNARRWSAWHTYVKMNTDDMKWWDEFQAVLTHELGHIIDLWVLIWTGRAKDSKFTEFWRPQRPINDPSISFYKLAWNSESVKKPQTNKLDFVSGYAMKGIYEDFAEWLNLYLNHNAIFKKMTQSSVILKKKYGFYDNLFGQDYFNDSSEIAAKIETTTRFWDSTKISEIY